jgi:hypothetical protein
MGYPSGVPRQTLASAGLAASIGAACLCALTLHLNPGVTLLSALPGLLLSLFLPWALTGAVCLVSIALVVTFARWWTRPFRPVVHGWPFLASLTFVALAAAAASYWYNLNELRYAISIDGVRSLAASAVAVTAAALVLLAIGGDLWLFPRQPRAFAGSLAILVSGAAVAVPLALRPPLPRPSEPPAVRLDSAGLARRVFVIGIDGLSPRDVDGTTALAPALARLAGRGAVAPLATIRPTEGPPVWTTLMTGRLPRDHGIPGISFYKLAGSSAEWPLLPRGALVGALERVGLATQRPVPSTARRCRALWNVLEAFGASSGLVRVWGTHPPEAIHGFVLSPYFHLFRGDERASTTLHPRELLDEIRARGIDAAQVDPGLLRELAEPSPATTDPLQDPALRRMARDGVAPDTTYQRAADVLRRAYDPAFLVVSFHGFDVAGHIFYRHAQPEAFGNVDSEDARRYGRVLGAYAAVLMGWVGGIEKEMRPGDLLVVVSGYGLAPTPLWRRLVGALTGTDTPTAGHGNAPPGVMVIVGDGIRAGARVRSASVLDVAPTLLYLLGLPVARDMEGRVLTELVDARFARENPLTFIRSYESLAVAPPVAAARDDLPPLVDEAP